MKRRGPGRAGAVLTDEDVHLFNEGTHDRAYLKLGSHAATREGEDGTGFAVWAPGAARVSVVGEWNGWKPDRHSLRQRGESGLFEGFVPGVGPGAVYKYHVASLGGYEVDKADPFAFRHEAPPRTGSVVWGLDLARLGLCASAGELDQQITPAANERIPRRLVEIRSGRSSL